MTGDFGADLDNYIVVQAKRYSKKVGVKAVQEVVAAKAHYGCREGIVVTSNL